MVLLFCLLLKMKIWIKLKKGFDVVLMGYNSMKINPIMSCEVSSINLNRYIGDMILLGTAFFSEF